MLLIAGLLLGLTSVAAQKKNPYGMADRERERRSLAVNIVRAINAAEANYKQKHGVYATWGTFFSGGDFTDAGTQWAPESQPTVRHAMFGAGPEIVPGWKLRLVLSKDAAAYDLVLEDVSDPKCGYAIFTDERGRIREGRSVDCPM